MEEIYWITRLDTIHGFAIAFLVVGIISLIVTAISFTGIDSYSDEDDGEVKFNNWMRKHTKYFWTGIILSVATITFVPTKNDALLIYGMGTVVDYIQENKDIKKIPDNAINAIVNWMEASDKIEDNIDIQKK